MPPLAEFHSKGVMVQRRQPCGLGKREPTPPVIAAGQFDLHVALPLSRPEWEIGERLLIEFKRDAHADTIALFNDMRNYLRNYHLTSGIIAWDEPFILKNSVWLWLWRAGPVG